jgi:sugar lactone lactonase YvrE
LTAHVRAWDGLAFMRQPTPSRAGLAVALALATLCLAPGAAGAVPACGDSVTPRPLVEGTSWLESIAFDARGRLLFTDVVRAKLMVLDRRGARPRALADVPAPGGIAVLPGNRALVGSGNTFDNGKAAPAQGLAKLLLVDLGTGRTRTYATGLSMANGVVRARDGTVYASDDFAPSLDRVSRRGVVRRAWSTVPASNGLALDRRGRHLYVNISFDRTRIVRVDVRDPRRVRTVAAPPAAESGALLDGLAFDARRRLTAAAFAAGEVWRVKGRGFCAVARDLPGATAVAPGRRGRGFSPSSLYVTTSRGLLVELRGVAR